MNKFQFFFPICLLFSLFVETSFIAFPFVYLFSLLYYIFFPRVSTIIVAFLAGIFLDILTISQIGLTPIIILGSFVLIDVLKKEFELKDFRIVILILFVGAFLFARFFSYAPSIFIYTILFLSTAVLFYFINKRKFLW